ncbi:DUF2314 domain-containing protein [Trichlorobacter lovleyi]|uniref:DUF2314 domain-containing protein n=1 Tax=Trichlorobacter lovleyi TaxID=313985 RepID=UPI00247FCA65|nr:DUF2314 domain-containing protein [Trichlorobacter lovleyi]
MKKILVLTIVAAFLLSACNSRADKSERVTSRPGEPDVIAFADNDQQMNKAIEQAKKTLNEFEKEIASNDNANNHYSLKVKFETNKEPEHIWVGDVKTSGQRFEGSLENEPINLKGLKAGDKVTFSKDQITDWLIVSSGKARGGFTIKVVRKQMSEKEQRAFDEETGGAFKE